MPDISRLTLRDFALAFALGGGLIVMGLMANVAQVRELALASGHALAAYLMLWALAGMLISGLMGLLDRSGSDDDHPRRGRRAPRPGDRLLARIRVTRDRRR